MTSRAALWQPSTAAFFTMLGGLAAHEAAYHLAGGDDFPFAVLAADTRVFVISHGGLDALGIGLLIVSMLWLIEAARIKEGRPL